MLSNYDVAKAVLRGEYGNGAERVQRLAAAGYNPTAVQSIVNALVAGSEINENECRLMKVEVDLTRYDGITLILRGVDDTK